MGRPVLATSSKSVAALFVGAIALAGCNNGGALGPKAEINEETKFSSNEYGVKGSPRVTVAKKVPKGGGRYQVGKPYKIKGKWYTPQEDPDYVATGKASWYGPNFHGRLTANGEIYDQYHLSAAHPTLPLPSYVRVTNLHNDRSVVVRVNDRGPFAHNRIIDLSSKAADLLDFKRNGTADVRVEYVGKARMDGLDQEFLLASYTGGPDSPVLRAGNTLLALAERLRPQPAEQIETQQVFAFNASAIPLPQPRPSYHASGLPLNVATSAPFASVAMQPLSYAQTRPADQFASAAFAAFDRRGEAAASGAGDPLAPVVIEVGLFDKPEAAHAVRSRVAALGLVSIAETEDDGRKRWAVWLMAGADVAETVVASIHARGLPVARVLD